MRNDFFDKNNGYWILVYCSRIKKYNLDSFEIIQVFFIKKCNPNPFEFLAGKSQDENNNKKRKKFSTSWW